MHDFVFANYSNGGNRVIIFCLPGTRQLFKQENQFFDAGTFKSFPTPFQQLFMIHGAFDTSDHKTHIIP